jgi:hypothetical protein
MPSLSANCSWVRQTKRLSAATSPGRRSPSTMRFLWLRVSARLSSSLVNRCSVPMSRLDELSIQAFLGFVGPPSADDANQVIAAFRPHQAYANSLVEQPSATRTPIRVRVPGGTPAWTRPPPRSSTHPHHPAHGTGSQPRFVPVRAGTHALAAFDSRRLHQIRARRTPQGPKSSTATVDCTTTAQAGATRPAVPVRAARHYGSQPPASSRRSPGVGPALAPVRPILPARWS